MEHAGASTPAAMEQTDVSYIEPIYAKGTGPRILQIPTRRWGRQDYGKLYNVIDSSDVLLHILNARDLLGTLWLGECSGIHPKGKRAQVGNPRDWQERSHMNWDTVCHLPLASVMHYMACRQARFVQHPTPW